MDLKWTGFCLEHGDENVTGRAIRCFEKDRSPLQLPSLVDQFAEHRVPISLLVWKLDSECVMSIAKVIAGGSLSES
ncbi:MAG: hypothetical protein WCK00_14970 [Deltaproteobacteria bacterium]